METDTTKPTTSARSLLIPHEPLHPYMYAWCLQHVRTSGVGRQVRVPICVKRALAKYVTFEAEFADGDYVFHRGYVTGTHQGEWQGIPPTGKQVKMKTLDIWRIADGKAVENWVQMDMLGLMQQLGVVPPPEHNGS
jgi:hypothetical protein